MPQNFPAGRGRLASNLDERQRPLGLSQDTSPHRRSSDEREQCHGDRCPHERRDFPQNTQMLHRRRPRLQRRLASLQEPRDFPMNRINSPMVSALLRAQPHSVAIPKGPSWWRRNASSRCSDPATPSVRWIKPMKSLEFPMDGWRRVRNSHRPRACGTLPTMRTRSRCPGMTAPIVSCAIRGVRTPHAPPRNKVPDSQWHESVSGRDVRRRAYASRRFLLPTRA